jgi:hypothetical protein
MTSLRRAYERHLSDAAMQIDDRRTPAEILATGPELCIPTAAAQTRIVSVARIRMDSRKSVRLFSGIICDDISEFESSHASQPVRSLWVRSGLQKYVRDSRELAQPEQSG